jgi:hypothetical protein
MMMKRLTLILVGGALALTGSTAALAETRAEKSEARLAKMLEGRTAGEPVKCISAFNGNNIQVIDHVGIVYDAGRTIYVARTTHPNQLDYWDVPVIERFGGQLCTNDMMRTVDRSSGHISGPLFLEDFVPYTKNG